MVKHPCGLAVFITVFIKLPQEWWIHIAQLDFTDFMADHPYLWFVLAGLVVAAGVVYWRYRSRLPVADWAFTVDVDRHLPELPAGPRCRNGSGRRCCSKRWCCWR